MVTNWPQLLLLKKITAVFQINQNSRALTTLIFCQHMAYNDCTFCHTTFFKRYSKVLVLRVKTGFKS